MQLFSAISNRSINIFVGAAICLGLSLLATLMLLENFTSAFESQTYPLKAYYNNIGELSEGAMVSLGGVDVGKVKTITLLQDERILVTAEITLRKPIPIDSFLAISSTTVSGDTYLAIVRGNSIHDIPHETNLEKAPVLRGIDFFNLSSISSVALQIAKMLKDTTKFFSMFTNKEEELAKNIDSIQLRLPALKDEYEKLSVRLKKSRPKFRELGEKISSTSQRLGEIEGNIANAFPEDIMKNIKDNLASLSSSEGKLSDSLESSESEINESVSNINEIMTWSSAFSLSNKSIAGVLTSKDCLGLSNTQKKLNDAITTVNDFSLMKKLGFYIKGRELFNNFFSRGMLKYMPSREVRYRWSLFKYQRFEHNCALPCGQKQCPAQLR